MYLNFFGEMAMKIKILILGVMMAAVLLLTGCSWLAKEPLDVLYYEADEDAQQSNLFIFMRGIGGSHRTFEEEGLVEEVKGLLEANGLRAVVQGANMVSMLDGMVTGNRGVPVQVNAEHLQEALRVIDESHSPVADEEGEEE